MRTRRRPTQSRPGRPVLARGPASGELKELGCIYRFLTSGCFSAGRPTIRVGRAGFPATARLPCTDPDALPTLDSGVCGRGRRRPWASPRAQPVVQPWPVQGNDDTVAVGGGESGGVVRRSRFVRRLGRNPGRQSIARSDDHADRDFRAAPVDEPRRRGRTVRGGLAWSDSGASCSSFLCTTRTPREMASPATRS